MDQKYLEEKKDFVCENLLKWYGKKQVNYELEFKIQVRQLLGN